MSMIHRYVSGAWQSFRTLCTCVPPKSYAKKLGHPWSLGEQTGFFWITDVQVSHHFKTDWDTTLPIMAGLIAWLGLVLDVLSVACFSWAWTPMVNLKILCHPKGCHVMLVSHAHPRCRKTKDIWQEVSSLFLSFIQLNINVSIFVVKHWKISSSLFYITYITTALHAATRSHFSISQLYRFPAFEVADFGLRLISSWVAYIKHLEFFNYVRYWRSRRP